MRSYISRKLHVTFRRLYIYLHGLFALVASVRRQNVFCSKSHLNCTWYPNLTPTFPRIGVDWHSALQYSCDKTCRRLMMCSFFIWQMKKKLWRKWEAITSYTDHRQKVIILPVLGKKGLNYYYYYYFFFAIVYFFQQYTSLHNFIGVRSPVEGPFMCSHETKIYTSNQI
jgi:hypothetical protein